ncbi:cytoplasmic protein NCK2 isoform X4 [Trachypithecus francoisi]|uniref:cytoplasmic protein NCK2 isoform X4 n=1 Tax=Trachypithecus francoisi TaxID=54180 RepID=UPI00141BB63B|nr:cytoplasmic protein NCK2 isoform X4 [Trachypithecus francoisi]
MPTSNYKEEVTFYLSHFSDGHKACLAECRGNASGRGAAAQQLQLRDKDIKQTKKRTQSPPGSHPSLEVAAYVFTLLPTHPSLPPTARAQFRAWGPFPVPGAGPVLRLQSGASRSPALYPRPYRDPGAEPGGAGGRPRWVSGPRPACLGLGRPLGGVTALPGRSAGGGGRARRRRALRAGGGSQPPPPPPPRGSSGRSRAAKRATGGGEGSAAGRLAAPGPAGSARAGSVRPAAGGGSGADKERRLGGRSAAAAPGPAPLPSGSSGGPRRAPELEWKCFLLQGCLSSTCLSSATLLGLHPCRSLQPALLQGSATKLPQNPMACLI